MSKLHPLLDAYVPTPDDPWDAVKAAHLLRRAGFGGTTAEIAQAVADGPVKTVDRLFDFPDAAADEQGNDTPDLSKIDDYPKSFAERQKLFEGRTPEERRELNQKLMAANRDAILATIGWWINRMASGPCPLQEKLSLFWHGHFTTSARDERSAWLMWQQNETWRRFAAGNFATFTKNVSRDPAMLDYLNNQQNRKGHPNENYARELMELFTLGRDNGQGKSNYSEDDIKEVARAFTGWGHDGDHYMFRPSLHDDDPKTVFGVRGKFDGDDVVNLILARPECANYIAGRLFSFFAYDVTDPALEHSLGDALRDNKYEMRPLLYTILTSKAFYSPAAIGTQIKSPIFLVTNAFRSLGLDGPVTRGGVLNALEQMGQMPFSPPNVKGWPGGRQWINTSTLFVRCNTAVNMVGRLDDAAIGWKSAASGEAFVDAWVARLIQRPIAADKRQELIDTAGAKPTKDSSRKMLELIVSMPDFQLC